MQLNDCFLLGSIVKTHGFKGQLVLKISKEVTSLPKKMEQLFVENKGKLVPFFVSEFSQNGDSALLKLDDIDSDTKAKEWLKCQVYVLKSILPKINKDAFQPQKYINFKVFDINNIQVGILDMFYDIPNNQLFGITHPTGKEILLPARQDFVKNIDSLKKNITFDFPEGLLEIYLEDHKQQTPDDI